VSTKFSKYQAATAIAVLFHTIGFAGIVIFKSDFIIQSTPFNLLLMFGLLIWTQREKNLFFWLFVLVTFAAGIVVEIIGVNTQLLFGDYSYGKVLGYQVSKVPVIIGINWFLVIYCCGITVQTILTKAITSINRNFNSANGIKGDICNCRWCHACSFY
jgi:bisanhydrobacterioruberin hydratase